MMAHQIQFDHVDPFKHARMTTAKAKAHAGPLAHSAPPVGLAVRYEGAPHVDADDMGWDRNEVPIPRTAKATKRNTRGPRDTQLSMTMARAPSTRIDSVLDVYAELYAEGDDDDDPGAATTYHPAPHHPAPSSKRDSFIPFHHHEHALSNAPVQPWDERGKNGLYGGGGRGADDRETGWVRGYSIGSSVPSVGFEEDLRFDDHDGHEDEGEDAPRSSSETVQSGSYPVTPTSTHFSAGPGPGPSKSAHESSPPFTASPPRSSAHSRTPSASQTTFRTPERPPRTNYSPAAPRDSPLSSSDVERFRKHGPAGPTSLPSPSAPLHVSKPLETHSKASTPTPTPKRSNSIFKRYGRSKRAPAISNPILPDGFVESLGMKTFTLTPGCKAPTYGDRDADADDHAPTTPRTPDRPAVPLNYPPRPPRDSPPTPSTTTTRPILPPQRTTSSSVSGPRDQQQQQHAVRLVSNAPPQASRGVHRQSDVYPHEALARLSVASDASARSDPTGPRSGHPTSTNHRQFFDQLRDGGSGGASNAATRTRTSDIPSVPLHPAREPYGGNFARTTPTPTTTRSSTLASQQQQQQQDVASRRTDGYERAWGSAAAVSREDERGHSMHWDARTAEEEEEEEDSATSSYSDHSELGGAAAVGSRRPSVLARDAVDSYYAQAQPHARDTRYDLDDGELQQRGGGGPGREYFETLGDEFVPPPPRHHRADVEVDAYGAGPIQPLNVKRSPPRDGSTPRAPLLAASSNRGGRRALDRGSTIDPFFTPRAGAQNQHAAKVQQAGPAIGVTGFRNPFG